MQRCFEQYLFLANNQNGQKQGKQTNRKLFLCSIQWRCCCRCPDSPVFPIIIIVAVVVIVARVSCLPLSFAYHLLTRHQMLSQ